MRAKMKKMSKTEVNILKKRIVVVKQVMDPKLCMDILKKFNKSPYWVDAQVGGNGEVDTDTRNCSVLPISNPTVRASDPEIMRIDSEIFKSAGLAVRAYIRQYPEMAESVSEDTGYELLRYKKGGFYEQHVDTFAHQPRSLSCSFALNENFEGGEWGFFDGAYKTRINAGDAILFPSNSMYPHEILKVTKGTRYSIITWFR